MRQDQDASEEPCLRQALCTQVKGKRRAQLTGMGSSSPVETSKFDLIGRGKKRPCGDCEQLRQAVQC